MLERLSSDQLQRIHEASIETMGKSGVRMLDREALDTLRAGGCQIDGDLARFPARLVEWALDVCPKSLTLYDQAGNAAIRLQGRCAYYGNGSDLLYIIDHRNGERRPPQIEDVRDMVRLVDALSGFAFVMSGFIPTDVPSASAQAWQMLAMLEHSTKPIVYVTTDLERTRAKIRMAEIVAGGAEALRQRPFAAHYVNISNPLRHNPESLRKLMCLAHKGLPVIYRPSIVTRGITTPVTWAGSLVVNNVAGLAGLVLSQLVTEGAPFIRCGCSGGTFDMRTMVGLHAAPELRGFNEDLAEYYRLPRFGIGGLSGSKDVDQQAALEAALTLIAATQSGAQLIHDVGYLDNGTTGSLEQLAICHEIIGWVKQYAVPLTVNDETLALAAIDDAVKQQTDFLRTENTLTHYREDWYPELIDRDIHDTWLAQGATTMRQRARVQVEEILSRHSPSRLPDATVKALRAIVAETV